MRKDSHDQFSNKLVELVPRLRRFAGVLTGSSHEGDDLVQSTLESAIKKQSQLRDEKSLDSWLFTILRSTWKNETRSRSVRRGNGLVDVQSLPDNNPVSDQEQVASSHQLREAVSRLPRRQKEVIALVDIEGMTYQEAAEILSIPKGTLMSRLARAREALLVTMTTRKIEKPSSHEKDRFSSEGAVNVH